MESSCSHPREAMNLVHVRRISRRNRTASLFQHAVSKEDTQEEEEEEEEEESLFRG